MATPIYENVTHEHAVPETDGMLADVEVAEVAVAALIEQVGPVESAEPVETNGPIGPAEPQRRRSSHRPVPWP